MGLGLCYHSDLPGIRRACILDLGGGVVSMVLGILFLMIEFTTVFINVKDVSLSLLLTLKYILEFTTYELIMFGYIVIIKPCFTHSGKLHSLWSRLSWL